MGNKLPAKLQTTSQTEKVTPMQHEKIMNIKGSYLIVGSILLLLSKVTLVRFSPESLPVRAIAVAVELSWWIFLVIGIIIMLRERKERKKNS